MTGLSTTSSLSEQARPVSCAPLRRRSADRRVAVLEHNAEIGRKILISGGGRCNFTNVDCRPENYISSNPHFHKSALARYTSSDFIALVEKHRIPYHHKTLGQLFCDRSARDITSMLLIECRDTKILTNCRATEIRRTTHFELETSFGSVKASCAGGSVRRPIHPKNGSYFLRLRYRPAVRNKVGSNAARARTADMERFGRKLLDGSQWRRN